MLTDLIQIRRLGEKKRDENMRLRMHLKRRNFQERRLLRIEPLLLGFDHPTQLLRRLGTFEPGHLF